MEKYGNILSENSGEDNKKAKHSRNHTITEEDRRRDKLSIATEFSKKYLKKEKDEDFTIKSKKLDHEEYYKREIEYLTEENINLKRLLEREKVDYVNLD
jgi:hypothetical protein